MRNASLALPTREPTPRPPLPVTVFELIGGYRGQTTRRLVPGSPCQDVFASCRARRSRRRRGGGDADARRRRQDAGRERPGPAGRDPRRVRSRAGRDRDPLGHLGRAAHLRRGRPRSLLRLRLGAGPQPRRPAAAALRPGPRPGGRVLRRRVPALGSDHRGRWVCTSGGRSGTRRRPPDFRANLDAFAAGINAYAEQHPDRLDDAAKAVLPVDGDRRAGPRGARSSSCSSATQSGVLEVAAGRATRGSNGWAIAPSRTADGHALLLANPHLPWGGEHTFFEAQLSAPGVYDAYGATLVGFPVLAIAFNDHLGWTHTVNTIDGGDLYVLTLDGDGYRFDGEVLPFETRTETIKVRQEDGTLREETLDGAPLGPRPGRRARGRHRRDPDGRRRRLVVGRRGARAVVGHGPGHQPGGVRGRRCGACSSRSSPSSTPTATATS